MSNKLYHRIGGRFFQILSLRLLEAVPIVGPYLSISWEMILAVLEEIEREQQREIHLDELENELRELTQTERENIVDDVLKSRSGQEATRNISEFERRNLRKNLINIPSEIDSIITRIELQEARERRDNKQYLKLVGVLEEKERKQQVTKLKQLLKEQLDDEQYNNVVATANKILDIKPGDRETIKALKFAEKRAESNITGTCFGVLVLLLFGIGIPASWIYPCLNWGSCEEYLLGVIFLTFTVIGVIFALVYRVYRNLKRRWPRN